MKHIIALLLTLSQAYCAITVQPSTLGNLFLTTETVSIPFTASGTATATWTIRDYWGTVIATGSGSPIQPGRTCPGWYEVEIKEGAATTLKTSFGVVTPVDVTAMQDGKFGATTHFSQFQDQSAIPLMAKIGLTCAGDDHYWASTEKPKGTYIWNPQFESYLAAFRANSLVTGVGLGWSNPLYLPAGAHLFTMPYDDAQRAGYANYALAILDHYKPQISNVGAWNEINGGTFVQGPAAANKPLYYHQMLKKLWETIKPVHPSVKVCAFNTVFIGHGFLRDAFAAGSLPYCDAVGVHPYRPYPDGVEIDISILQTMIRAANAGKNKEIWAGEFGGISATSDAARANVAPYLAQIVTLMLSQGVNKMSWFQLMDDSTWPTYGLMGSSSNSRGKFRPHPALIAYANLIRQIGQASPRGRITTPASIYAFKFMHCITQNIVAIWSNHPETVELITAAPITVTDIMGGAKTISPTSGKVTLGITKNVQYVAGTITAVTPVNSKMLADSVSGHSQAVGKNGWSYGYAVPVTGAVYKTTDFKPLTWAPWGEYGYRWLKPPFYPFAYGYQMHPTGEWVIRRWVSNYAGPAILSGDFSRGSGGDGTEIRIFVDGVEVHRINVAPSQPVTTYSVPVTLKVGSKVDFTMNCKAESSYDATNLTAVILRTP